MSDTDHSRKPGGHTVMTKTDRRMLLSEQFPTWETVFNGTRKPVILAATEVNDHVMTDGATKPRLCKFCRAPLVEEQPLAEWERILLGYDDDGTEDPAYDYCDYDCLEDHTTFEEAGLSWKVSDDQLDMTDQWLAVSQRREFIDLDVDEEAYGGGWLPIVSIEEARDIFGGGDFTIDWGNVVRWRVTKPAGRW